MKDTLKIIGNHPLTRNVRRRIRRIAPTDLHVMICGEYGTEKETVAREIHRKSLRDQNVFIALDCYSLPELKAGNPNELLQNNYGKASGGTLYLESLEAMSIECQRLLYKMLTARNKKQVRYDTRKPRGVRIIASVESETLESLDLDNRLLQEINRYMILVSPLRKRKSDLPLLFDYYLRIEAGSNGMKESPAVSEDIFESVIAHDWKGNITELRNVIETLVDLSPKDAISPEAVPFPVRDNRFSELEELDYHEALRELDVHLIKRALEKSGWNRTQAARLLKMTEGNIRLKIKKYTIVRET